MANSRDNRIVGILGGMSWESTVTYYQEINRRYHAVRGGHHSAPLLIHSVNFAPIEGMQRSGDWGGTAGILTTAARGLEAAGAGLLLLATNTMHLVFPELEEATATPWVHIADATGAALRRDGISTIGLLGTRFTMEEPFYRDRLAARFGIETIVPDEAGRREIDRVIFEELVHGTTAQSSRERFRREMAGLAAAGAGAIVLGCTEIGLLVGSGDSELPTYDTALLHAAAAVDWLLGGGEEPA
jgi:aspartate racemase